jgi:uncharacterized Zn finger protein
MTTQAALSRVLTRRHVQRLASGTSFQRGEDYATGGRVRSLVVRQDALTATVAGSAEYAVRLEVRDGALQHQCSCPVGTDGEFCKHCVAVAVAWLNANEGKAPGKPENTAAVVRLDDVRPFLLKRDKATLADWLLEAAENDERLRERLLRQAARTTGKGDFKAYRRSIDRATSTGGFVHYREAFDFAQGIAEAVAPLRGLLDDGQAAEVIDLAEHALLRVSKAILEMDDSDGGMSPILDDLQELHLQACRRARPDPEKLAARLFDWEIDGEWDVFGGAAETYADVLGEKGLALYRARAEALWHSLPALKPGQREEYSSRRFNLTRIMEALARASGDLEALVAVKAKDLTLPYHFLQIAELYRKARKTEAALDWAERGVKAFPDHLDSRLIEFLAEEYHARQRHEEALALIWRLFERRPGLEYFQLLRQHADRTQAWPPWRERALSVLRAAGAGGARPRSGMAHWFRPADHSELVRVFLWEKETERAWQEAQSGGCSSPLWLELAASREAHQPADAANVYLRESEKLVPQKNNGAYAEAIRLLTKARALMLGLSRGEEWQAAIDRLRLTHKAKRNFIALAAKL